MLNEVHYAVLMLLVGYYLYCKFEQVGACSFISLCIGNVENHWITLQIKISVTTSSTMLRD